VDTHRHRWAAVDFFVDDDRPMMRKTCSCGAARDIPAWDRSWTPPDADGTGMFFQDPDGNGWAVQQIPERR
jgi:hypothetical protein